MGDSTDKQGRTAGSYVETAVGLAMKALLMHTQVCEQCTEDYRECATGRTLVRTVRDARRGHES
jgi:hypothetical protein